MTFKRKDLDNTTLIIEGTFLKYIKESGVYLSSSNTFFNLCVLNLYSDIRLVSANNPQFEGTPYTDFVILNTNKININLNSSIPVGVYDIIFCNPAGYVKGSRKNNKPVFEIID